MKEKIEDFGLYVIITDPYLSYEEIAQVCVRQNVRMLQLRQKELCDRELVSIGRQIASITKGTGTLFCINDRADIAVACGADALHLGQEDMAIEDARKIVGDDIIIGLSSQTIEQAQEALSKNPDYIAFGPIFETSTRVKANQPVGLKALKQVVELAQDVPVVAIGGLFPETLGQIAATGAKSFAMIEYLMESSNFENRMQKARDKFW